MSRKITFICTGNTCRSVMAQGLFETLKSELDIESDSAGTAAKPHYAIIGDLKYVMDEKGIDYSGHKAKLIDAALMEESEFVFVMTADHKLYLDKNFNMAEKTFLLSEYAIQEQKDIIDPIGLGKDAYRKAYMEIERCVQGLIRKLKDES